VIRLVLRSFNMGFESVVPQDGHANRAGGVVILTPLEAARGSPLAYLIFG
jgi:hypothetical protein